MEIVESQDKFTVGPDGKPSRVTDYKLAFPQDFRKVQTPELLFTTDKNYIQTSFRIVRGPLASDITTLKERKKAQGNLEHAILSVNDGVGFYQAKTVLTGETGIGFQITLSVAVNDYLHTHSIREGEEDRKVDLFSAFDLWSMGSKGAERYWLVGKDATWSLVNLYGQQYYHYIKEACWEMAKKENMAKSYESSFSDLIDCVNKCNYRLYRSEDSIDYALVS
jgi:hypothetical protein